MGRTIDLLIKGASGSLITRVLGMGLAFGAHVLTAQLVGVEIYGRYFFALTVINVLALVGKFGCDTATLRFVPEYLARQEWSLVTGFFRRVNQLVSLTSIFLASAVAGVIFFLMDDLGRELKNTFWVACFVLPVTAIIQVRSAGVQAFKKVVLAQIPPEVIRPIAMIIVVVLVFGVFNVSPSAHIVMVAELLSLFLGIVVLSLMLRNILPAGAKSTPTYRTRTWLATALPLSLLSGLIVVLNHTGILLVGAIQGTTESGIFGVVARIATLIAFGLNAVNSIAAPMISELYWGKQMKELQRMLSVAALGIFVFSVPVCLGIVIFGKFILSLFGPEFVDGYAALIILALGQLANAFAGPTGFLMSMTGHQREAAWIMFIGVVLNIILSIILIPLFGLVGASLSTASAIVFWNVMMYRYVWRTIKVDSTLFAFLRSER